MGFVVKKIPLRGEIVFDGPGPIVGIGKSFNTGAKNGEFFPKINGPFPDDFSNITTRSN